MSTGYNSCSIKEIIKSFKCWPDIFRFIWGINKRYLILIFILSIIQGFIPSILIIATQELINAIQVGASKGDNYIVAPFIIYILFTVLSGILNQVKNYFESLFKIKLSFKTSLAILEKAITLELKDFENATIYDMLRRAQNDTGDKPYMIFSQILDLLSQIITLISTSILLLVWKWWIVLVILIIPIISSLYSIKIGNLQYKIQRDRSQDQRKAWYLNYLLTNDISFKEIKLYGISNYFLNKFNLLNKEFIIQDRSIIIKSTKINIIFELLDQFIGTFTMFLIIKDSYTGKILIGNTIAYIRCISNVQGNTRALVGNLVNMYQNNLYINQFFEFINFPIDNNKTKGLDLEDIETIELKNISYKYENRDNYAVKNVNLTLKLGERLALIGHNGSGKTTLVKIISGFYDNYEGDIFVNGVNLKELNLEQYRRRIGMVFQDYSKYELSLRENISVGDIINIKNDKVLIKALFNANGIDILKNLSQGLDSQLGVWFDNGVQLSGGQWQKLALSRAFLRNSDIYILDEPSSALDPIAEYDMLCKCYDLIRNKIGIFITHRLFNIKRIATKIIVLNNGEVVEEGNHNQLMDMNGYYTHLYNMQNIDESFEVE